MDIRYSIAKQDALGPLGSYPGNTNYGRHARVNMGVSVVRENREVVLDKSMLITEAGGNSAALNRWWGCEVRFGAGCDDLFGIDHNKQMASHFSRALKELSETGLSDTDARDEIDANESPIYEVAEHVRRTVRSMMREIGIRFSQRPATGNGSQGPQTPTTPEQKAESLATEATAEGLANQDTEKTETDKTFEQTTAEEKISEIAEQLTQAGYPAEQAQIEAEATVKSGYRYKLANASLNAFTVFNVSNAKGVLVVQLNINHPIYRFLESLKQAANANEDTDADEERAAVGLLIMILGLARMDDESQGEDRLRFQDTCYKWGRVMAKIIDEGTINVDG